MAEENQNSSLGISGEDVKSSFSVVTQDWTTY